MLAVAQVERRMRVTDPDPAFLTPRTAGSKSHAKGVLQVLDAMGYRRQPWLERMLPEALAVDDDGDWLHSDVVISVPRQVGKTTLLGPVFGHRALSMPRSAGWLTAQTRQFAADLVITEWGSRMGYPELGGQLRRGSGSETVTFPNGSTVRPFPPSADGLHGRFAHIVGVDEVWAMRDGVELEQAIRPTLTTTGGQTWWVSTAGDATSGLLRRLVDAGRAGNAFLAEWAVPPDTAVHVEGLLHDATPASLGEAVDLILEHHPGVFARRAPVLAAAGSMAPAEFLRAYGNVWTQATRGMIPAQRWAQRRWQSQAGAPWPRPGKPLYLGIAADPVGGGSAIVASWHHKVGTVRRALVDVIEAHPGTEWLPARLAWWNERLRPRKVAVDRGDPAASAVETAILSHGVARGRVEFLTSGDYALACGRIVDAVLGGDITHAQDDRLTDAVLAGEARQMGDRWVWDRRAGKVACLVAATVALRALERTRVAEAPVILG